MKQKKKEHNFLPLDTESFLSWGYPPLPHTSPATYSHQISSSSLCVLQREKVVSEHYNLAESTAIQNCLGSLGYLVEL